MNRPVHVSEGKALLLAFAQSRGSDAVRWRDLWPWVASYFHVAPSTAKRIAGGSRLGELRASEMRKWLRWHE